MRDPLDPLGALDHRAVRSFSEPSRSPAVAARIERARRRRRRSPARHVGRRGRGGDGALSSSPSGASTEGGRGRLAAEEADRRATLPAADVAAARALALRIRRGRGRARWIRGRVRARATPDGTTWIVRGVDRNPSDDCPDAARRRLSDEAPRTGAVDIRSEDKAKIVAMPRLPSPPGSSALRHLLLTPGLARGLDRALPPPCIPTGLPHLDALLGGGVPRGVPDGDRRRARVVGTNDARLRRARAPRRRRARSPSCIDLPDAFDPEHADAAGVALARLLWMRPRTSRSALQAAEHVLDADGFALVLVDLDDGRAASRRRAGGVAAPRARRDRARAAAVVILAITASPRARLPRCGSRPSAAERAVRDGAGPCPLFDGHRQHRPYPQDEARGRPPTSTTAAATRRRDDAMPRIACLWVPELPLAAIVRMRPELRECRGRA